jgi:hypothetical protein
MVVIPEGFEHKEADAEQLGLLLSVSFSHHLCPFRQISYKDLERNSKKIQFRSTYAKKQIVILMLVVNMKRSNSALHSVQRKELESCILKLGVISIKLINKRYLLKKILGRTKTR